MRLRSRRPPAGFTLVELLVVVVIIGILLGFILVAGLAGIRNAENEATRGLIAKLDQAVMDRLDALLAVRPAVTGPVGVAGTHQWMAAFTSGATVIPGPQRAQVIARIDMIRAEMPDVWFPDAGDSNFPVKFGGVSDFGATPSVRLPVGADAANTAAGSVVFPISGINGASFTAMAGITKNLGYAPAGYDGVDNDGDGIIDDVSNAKEGNTTAAAVLTRVALHTHNTARAEMLYALLVEGLGPLGSSFNKDDFTSREVKDTDGDGLPEFIDAWGRPLQFYRWPLYDRSDTQRGGLNPEGFDGVDNDGDGTVDNVAEACVYSGATEAREQNPLDPNQQLVSPGWWAATANAANSTPTPMAQFQSLFFSLEEDSYLSSLVISSGTPSFRLWDRGCRTQRRAFSMRPLIVSAGPDGNLGLFQLGSLPTGAGQVLAEGHAIPLFPKASGGATPPASSAIPPTSTVTVDMLDGNNGAGFDDISNQNILAPGGPR